MRICILKNESGLTLIEVLLVSVLLVLLTATLYSSVSGIVSTKNIVESQREIYKTASNVFARFSRELTGISTESLSENTNDVTANSSTDPFRGNAAFEIKDKKDNSENSDILRFVSTTGAQQFFSNRGNRGLVEIEYRLVENKEKESFFSNDNKEEENSNKILLRKETPSGVSNKEILAKKTIITPISANIIAINYRAMFEGEWKDIWTLKNRNQPSALEVALKIRAKDGTTKRLKTAFLLKNSQ